MPVVSRPKKVESFVRSQIVRRKWLPGQRLPSDMQISEKLLVGFQSVKTAMARLAEEGIVERKPRLGTFVASNHQIASIAVRVSGQMLAVPRTSSIHARMLALAMRRISAAGYQAMVVSSTGYMYEEPETTALRIVQSLSSSKIVGVISIARMGPLEKLLAKRGIQSVSVATGRPIDKHAVILDYEVLAQMGREHLLAKGYDDYVVMDMELPVAERNMQVARDTEIAREIATGGERERLILCPFSPSGITAYEAFKHYWRHGHMPRAIFFLNDVVFDMARSAILELGIRVPDDLAIITSGYKGSVYPFYCPITALEFDPDATMNQAWKIFEGLLGGKEVEQSVVNLKPELKEGEST